MIKIKEKAVLLWLPNKTHIELKRYSKKWNVSVSEAIRRALTNLFIKEK